ncbi:MAG: NHLP leader peptide family RiPP precursor [Leptolyngbya sp. BL-A-14]
MKRVKMYWKFLRGTTLVVPTPDQLTQTIARALRDPAFRFHLQANPKRALQENGISVSDDQNVTVLESKAGQIFFVLPIETEAETEHLQAAVASGLPQRAIRASIILRAWRDRAYKTALLASPKVTLLEAGMPIPPTTELTVLENTPEQLYLVLPHVH